MARAAAMIRAGSMGAFGKSEIRNPKSEGMTNDETRMTKTETVNLHNFGLRVSGFGFSSHLHDLGLFVFDDLVDLCFVLLG